MADIEITETALRAKQANYSRDSLLILSRNSFDSIYRYYGTTPQLFRENMLAYQSNLDDYQKMLEEKLQILIKIKDSISMMSDSTNRVADVE